MKETYFWKNFGLGQELNISGVFIYNGLRCYHEMKKLDFTDEVFEFFYNLSVGIERLLKIAIILFEHHDLVNQDDLEKSLITHSHLNLLNRLKKHTLITLGPPHIAFLNLLEIFYKSFRYDRFTLTSVSSSKNEIKELCNFLRKHLKVDIHYELDILNFGIPNEDRYRKFIDKIVLKISSTLYEIIKNQAKEIDLYTYELRHGSKAETVFLRKNNIIMDEDILWKELLLFFMNTKSSSSYLDFLRGISPLDFDPNLVGDYLNCFQSNASKALVMDEIEEIYKEIKGDKKERFELIKFIGSSDIYFDSIDDGDDDTQDELNDSFLNDLEDDEI